MLRVIILAAAVMWVCDLTSHNWKAITQFSHTCSPLPQWAEGLCSFLFQPPWFHFIASQMPVFSPLSKYFNSFNFNFEQKELLLKESRAFDKFKIQYAKEIHSFPDIIEHFIVNNYNLMLLVSFLLRPTMPMGKKRNSKWKLGLNLEKSIIFRKIGQ